MATESIEIKLLVEGEQAATRALSSVTGQISKLDTAQKQAAVSSKAQTAALGAATQGAAKFQSTIGIAAQAVGTFSTSGGKMVSILGQTAGAMATVAGSMGPVGIAITGVTAAVGLLATAFVDSKTAAANAKDEMKSLIPTLNEIISKMEQARAALNLRARVRDGLGTPIEQGARASEAEAAATAAGRKLTGLQSNYEALLVQAGASDPARGAEFRRRAEAEDYFKSLKREIDTAADSYRELTEQASRYREMAGAVAAVTTGPVAPSGGNRPRGGGGSGPSTDIFRSQSRINGVAGMAPNGSLESLMGGSYGDTGGLGDLTGGFKTDQDAIEKQMKMEADARQQVADAIDEQKRAMDDLAFSAGTTAVDAFEMLASSAVSGGKISAKAFVAMAGGFLKATGQQMLGQGIKNQFEAAALMTNPVTAAFGVALAGVASGQIATGAAMMAGGVVANIGAAAIKEPGGGGGGGGSSRGSFGPTASGYGDSRGYQGPSTIVVNLENAVLANTYADAGKIINRAVREAELRYGKT